MKGRTLLVIFLLSAPTKAWAGPVTFGVKGGVTLATMNQDAAYEAVVPFETRTGWTGGAFVLYPLEKAISLQGDITYVSRGASLGESDIRDGSGASLGSFETFLKRDDLDIGLRARFAIAHGEKIQPYLTAGPSVSFELDEKTSTEPPNFLLSLPSHLLKSTGFGVTFGAGTEIPLGPGQWLLEANYDLGMTDLAEDSVNGSLHASTWRFMTGYHF
jgi:Outer membrane protein beta-barrel domain